MSNFLTRMLDRTFGSSDVVRPVVEPILANEVTAGDGHSMTASSDERKRDLPKKGESTENSGTDAFAPGADLPSVPSATDKRTLRDGSMQSNRIGESQIVSGRDILIEADEAGGEQRLSSGERAARDVSGRPGKPENHIHSGPEEDMQRIVSEQVETSETSGLSEKHNMDSQRSSSETGAERGPALIQKKAAPSSSFNSHVNAEGKVLKEGGVSDIGGLSETGAERGPALIRKKAAPGSSFNSHVNAEGKVLKEGGVSDIGGLSDKHDGSKTRSYNIKPRSEKLLESSSPVKELKGADKEDLLIPSDFERHSHPEASSGLKQKGLSIETGTSFGRGVSSTAPVVKVTIGRIEVRAVTQQASSPRRRTAPAQPRLSLADYLKRRDGGLQ